MKHAKGHDGNTHSYLRQEDPIEIRIAALNEDHGRAVWSLIEQQRGLIATVFNKMFDRKTRNAGQNNRMLHYFLGIESMEDIYFRLYNNLANKNKRELKRYEEGISVFDFKGYNTDLRTDSSFFRLTRALVNPKNEGHAIVASLLSNNTRAALNALRIYKEKRRQEEQRVRQALVRVLNAILLDVDLAGEPAFSTSMGRAEKGGAEVATISLRDNWRLLCRVFPKALVRIENIRRERVRPEDIEVEVMAAHLVAGLRKSDQYVRACLTDEEWAHLAQYGACSTVKKYAALLCLCHELNDLLAADALVEQQSLYTYLPSKARFNRVTKLRKRWASEPAALRRLCVHQNRLVLESIFAEAITPSDVKFQKWMYAQVNLVCLDIRREMIRKSNNQSTPGILPDNGHLDNRVAPHINYLQVWEELIDQGVRQDPEYDVLQRILEDSFVQGYNINEIVDRLNKSQYKGGGWYKKKVINKRKRGIELLGRYMYLRDRELVEYQISRYPSKELAVIAVNCIRPEDFDCVDDDQGLYVFSGYTPEGAQVILPMCKAGDIQSAFQWLKGQGFHGTRWVVSGYMDGVWDAVCHHFESAIWQLCHKDIQVCLNYHPGKKSVVQILKSPTREHAERLLVAFEPVTDGAYHLGPEVLKYALNHLELKARENTKDESTPERIVPLKKRELSFFHSTPFHDLKSQVGIDKSDSMQQVQIKLEDFLVGKRFLCSNANKIRMPEWV